MLLLHHDRTSLMQAPCSTSRLSCKGSATNEALKSTSASLLVVPVHEIGLFELLEIGGVVGTEHIWVAVKFVVLVDLLVRVVGCVVVLGWPVT